MYMPVERKPISYKNHTRRTRLPLLNNFNYALCFDFLNFFETTVTTNKLAESLVVVFATVVKNMLTFYLL